MARMSKQEKAIKENVDAAFLKYSNGNPINMMDIGKVLDAGRDAAKNGQDIDAAVKAAFEKYAAK